MIKAKQAIFCKTTLIKSIRKHLTTESSMLNSKAITWLPKQCQVNKIFIYSFLQDKSGCLFAEILSENRGKKIVRLFFGKRPISDFIDVKTTTGNYCQERKFETSQKEGFHPRNHPVNKNPGEGQIQPKSQNVSNKLGLNSVDQNKLEFGEKFDLSKPPPPIRNVFGQSRNRFSVDGNGNDDPERKGKSRFESSDRSEFEEKNSQKNVPKSPKNLGTSPVKRSQVSANHRAQIIGMSPNEVDFLANKVSQFEEAYKNKNKNGNGNKQESARKEMSATKLCSIFKDEKPESTQASKNFELKSPIFEIR